MSLKDYWFHIDKDIDDYHYELSIIRNNDELGILITNRYHDETDSAAYPLSFKNAKKLAKFLKKKRSVH